MGTTIAVAAKLHTANMRYNVEMDYYSQPCACGASLAPVIYGIPTPEMVQLAIDGVIALGGSKFGGITHYCYSCNNTFPFED